LLVAAIERLDLEQLANYVPYLFE
jgi:hypothetical protein